MEKWVLEGGRLKIRQKIGKLTLAKLIEGVKEVQVSKSVYRSMPAKYWKALEKIGVKVIVKNDKRGRKPLDCKIIEKIERCKEEVGSIRACSTKLGISRRTFYNLKKRCGGKVHS